MRDESGVERALKVQIFVSTVLMTLALIPLCLYFLPDQAHFGCTLDSQILAQHVSLDVAPFNNFTDGAFKHCTKTVASFAIDLPKTAPVHP